MSASRLKPVLICLVIALAVGIFTAMSFPVSPTLNQMLSPNQRQGVSGMVTRLQGNQMPMVNRNNFRTAPSPVSTQVWIFSGRISSKGTHWPVSEAQNHPNLVSRVQSDNQGKFFVSLPPGEYTLFARDGDNLYLNSFMGDGSYESVQVKEGQITEIRLVNTEDAVF
jgi:hypothetical protein